MFKRKIYSALDYWKNNHLHEALLVKGARQVGKTTIIRAFGKDNYKHLVEINFEQDPDAKSAFSGRRDTETIINRLSVMGYGPFVPGKTLVFLDEIQSCPDARTAIKFLVEDGRFDYIESESLLGINYGEVSSFPIGYESQIEMFPMDFEEWLWANGIDESVIDVVKQNFIDRKPVDDLIHQQLMRHYKNYLVVGGMPKVVGTYLSVTDFTEVKRQQRIIIDSYRFDIAKYAGSSKARAKRFFDAIPSQLSKPHRRYMLNDLEKSGNMSKYADAAQWLSDAGVALFCYNTHALEMPFEQYENLNLFKVYLLDTGLLCAMWGDDVQWQVLQGRLDVNEGALTENFVAAELTRRGHRLHYYDHKSRNELDFLLGHGNRLRILEVKSGNSFRNHKALDNALALYDDEILEQSIVLCNSNLSQERKILYIPLYMAMFL